MEEEEWRRKKAKKSGILLSAAVNHRINQKAFFSASLCPILADRASISFPFEMTQMGAIVVENSKKVADK